MSFSHRTVFTRNLVKRGVFGVIMVFVSVGLDPALAKVLARVNGVEITDDDLKLAADDLGPRLPHQLQGKAREAYLLNFLVDRQLVVQAAVARKVNDNPDFARRLAYLQEKALFDTMIGDVAKNASKDDVVKAAYDELSEKQKHEIEYHLRQIVFTTENDAKAAHERLNHGEDFAKVVADFSKESGSNGGDLGWVSKEFLAAQFGEELLNLEPGHFSLPVKVQNNWAIVKLDEKRQKTLPPLEQIRVQLQRYVEQKAQGDFVAGLRGGAKIEREDNSPMQQSLDLSQPSPSGQR